MATKKRPSYRRDISELAKNILQDLRDGFVAQSLSTQALTHGYVGPPISQLRQKYSVHTQVDFDLALKELEEALFVKTGPMVPFDNRPGSNVFIVGLFSKREYMYLTEAGYRAMAEVGSRKLRTNPPHVHISGTFHQSPIGIGDQFTQQQNIHVENDADLIERLAQLLSQSGGSVDQASRTEIAQIVELTHQGDLKAVKPLFQKLFGLASETVKQTAWGILTALITKAIGM
jgi:hypothetical protein